ncbi:hypothetical protein FCV25MIE_27549, partial [Fagus crenata]
KWRGENLLAPDALVRVGMDLLNLYKGANVPLFPLPNSKPLTWSPPSLPFFKVNIAVCSSLDPFYCGVSFVMCDFIGHCVLAYADKVRMEQGFKAQLSTFVLALQVSLEPGINEVQFESSHGLAVSTCGLAQMDSGYCGNLVLEINRLASLFCICKFTSIPPRCNVLALELATYACNISSSETWLGTIPPFLINLV